MKRGHIVAVVAPLASLVFALKFVVPHINYVEAQQVLNDGALVNLFLTRWEPDDGVKVICAGRQPSCVV